MTDPKSARPPARRRRRLIIGLAALAGFLGVLYVLYGGGRHRGPGTVDRHRLPPAEIAARSLRQSQTRSALGVTATKQILFGDLHVHTTFSADAFMRSLPILHGEGAHPPADACDYARYCSGLDFFAITDHAESLSPTHWAETRETIRQCNAAAGPPSDPDIVAFSGFEWTQVGRTPAEHYGHKNVIFRETDDAHLPVRPIAAGGPLQQALAGRGAITRRTAFLPITDFGERREYLDLVRYLHEMNSLPECAQGVNTRALPLNCREVANTPRQLFDKLDQWGFDALVIPHGSTWGFYTPPGYRYAAHLTREQTDPRREFLIEVFSGHGNSEEYRSFHEVEYDPAGTAVCPASRRDYEPCCRRAGEIIRARCGSIPGAECDRRVAEAQSNYLAAGVSGFLTVPGATVDDWGDCGQCRDCFDPAFNYRPGGSVQSILASADFSDPAAPRYPSWGLLASSDNHSARPGTGYKEINRRSLTDTAGARDEAWHERLLAPPSPPNPTSDPLTDRDRARFTPWQQTEFERMGSFFLTGGLVAVHAEGRDREAIWSALQRREVYGTSGERILLWFDLVGASGATVPMGGETTLTEAPHFVVRAAGSFVQQPGCPPDRAGPSPERIEHLCRGECYNPGDARHRITRIEVVRIRPQRHADDSIDSLIEDHWRTIPCTDNGTGCRAEFDDPEFATAGQRTMYYVRAIQEPTPAINAANLRCERDAEGRCVRVHPCYADFRTPMSDDCLAPNEERAWSSPITVLPAPR